MGFTNPGAHRRKVATVAFLCATATIALYLWTRSTVIHGDAAAATLLELAQSQFGASAVRADCDPQTPVTADGASVECTVHFADRSELYFDLRYGSDGRIKGVPIEARSVSRSLGPP